MNVPSESTGERAIKAELEHMGIRYEQEKDISSLYGDTKSHRRADFYLPDYDVYIEFLGGWDAPDEEKREPARRPRPRRRPAPSGTMPISRPTDARDLRTAKTRIRRIARRTPRPPKGSAGHANI